MPTGCMKSGTLPGNQQHSAGEVYDGLTKRGVSFPGAIIGVAISYRESRFNDKAYCINYNGKGTDRGIFQFNSIAFPHLSDNDAYDFDKNLDYYVKVSRKSTALAPWGGAPGKDEQQAAADMVKKNVFTDPPGENPVSGTILAPFGSIVDFLNWLTSHIGSVTWWLNIAKTLTGLFLIAFGLIQLAKLYEKSIPSIVDVK